MYTSYAYAANIEWDVTSGEGATRTVWPLTIDDLHKTYRRGDVANDGMSIHINPAEVECFVGPNGAVKTMLVEQVIRLIAPTGRVTLGPYDLVANPGAAR